MLVYDSGLFLRSPRLAIDVPRRQPCAFVSHAHKDHAARHAWTIATHATLTLLATRGLRPDRQTVGNFGESFDFHNTQLTLLPAGHMLGAAMLYVEGADGRDESLLYTGDFRLRRSELTAGAEPRRADVLVMETTFGDPLFRFPNRSGQADVLAATVQRVVARGDLPVVHAYEVGKSQELQKLLTNRGLSVTVHPRIAAMSHVYQCLGVDTGPGVTWDEVSEPMAIITPPNSPQLPPRLPPSLRQIKIAATGWAMQKGYARRYGYEYALPISDHADYDELLELVERVQPKKIYCTHGDGQFVADLCNRGWDATWIGAA